MPSAGTACEQLVQFYLFHKINTLQIYFIKAEAYEDASMDSSSLQVPNSCWNKFSFYIWFVFLEVPLKKIYHK